MASLGTKLSMHMYAEIHRVIHCKYYIIPLHRGIRCKYYIIPLHRGTHCKYYIIPLCRGIHCKYYIIPLYRGIHCKYYIIPFQTFMCSSKYKSKRIMQVKTELNSSTSITNKILMQIHYTKTSLGIPCIVSQL